MKNSEICSPNGVGVESRGGVRLVANHIIHCADEGALCIVLHRPLLIEAFCVNWHSGFVARVFCRWRCEHPSLARTKRAPKQRECCSPPIGAMHATAYDCHDMSAEWGRISGSSNRREPCAHRTRRSPARARPIEPGARKRVEPMPSASSIPSNQTRCLCGCSCL